ncbi:MAG: UTP--glucose-1-phosphate uridylyltransferase [Spirochaetales bacterium]|nr:UTP--glucose-1-phosphate uridylyltransferase [Spirochaetales bacterium]
MKGLIVAAGYGSRFLPVTKTIPKEMLPILNIPSIEFIIKEFTDSGITDILIISSRRKKVLEDYFDREIELEWVFEREKDEKKLREIQPAKANVHFIRQQEMKGTGQALLLAKSFMGNDPFVVAYPDDIFLSDKPLAAQLIEKYRETQCTVLSTMHNPPDLNRYGVLALDEKGVFVRDIVEKPAKGQEPSQEASCGRYLYTPEIFEHLEADFKKHGQGEFFHISALKKLAEQNKVVFQAIDGIRLDTGDPKGYLRSILLYANEIPEYRAILAEFYRNNQF